MYLFLIITAVSGDQSILEASEITVSSSAFPSFIVAQNSSSFIDIVNTGRRNFANKFNVANMNELEDDWLYALHADSMWTDCLDKSELYNQNDYEVVPVMEKAKESEEEKEMTRIAEAYLNNPGQLFIGIARKSKCRRELDYNTIYVLGPLNKMSVVKNGPPGSKCDEGRVNRNGLCAKKQ